MVRASSRALTALHRWPGWNNTCFQQDFRSKLEKTHINARICRQMCPPWGAGSKHHNDNHQAWENPSVDISLDKTCSLGHLVPDSPQLCGKSSSHNTSKMIIEFEGPWHAPTKSDYADLAINSTSPKYLVVTRQMLESVWQWLQPRQKNRADS